MTTDNAISEMPQFKHLGIDHGYLTQHADKFNNQLNKIYNEYQGTEVRVAAQPQHESPQVNVQAVANHASNQIQQDMNAMMQKYHQEMQSMVQGLAAQQQQLLQEISALKQSNVVVQETQAVAQEMQPAPVQPVVQEVEAPVMQEVVQPEPVREEVQEIPQQAQEQKPSLIQKTSGDKPAKDAETEALRKEVAIDNIFNFSGKRR